MEHRTTVIKDYMNIGELTQKIVSSFHFFSLIFLQRCRLKPGSCMCWARALTLSCGLSHKHFRVSGWAAADWLIWLNFCSSNLDCYCPCKFWSLHTKLFTLTCLETGTWEGRVRAPALPALPCIRYLLFLPWNNLQYRAVWAPPLPTCILHTCPWQLKYAVFRMLFQREWAELLEEQTLCLKEAESDRAGEVREEAESTKPWSIWLNSKKKKVDIREQI